MRRRSRGWSLGILAITKRQVWFLAGGASYAFGKFAKPAGGEERLKTMARVLKPFTETIVQAISANDPLTIADGLMSKGLLTTEVYASLQDANYSNKERARKIICQLLAKLESEPEAIHDIIDEFHAKDLGHLSDMIEQELSK